MIPNSKVAWFFDEGLKIQDVQYVSAPPSTDSTLMLAGQMPNQAVNFRHRGTRSGFPAKGDPEAHHKDPSSDPGLAQNPELMLQIGDKVSEQALKTLSVQDEKLFLPSDFPS
ncbi:hypothetical protein B0H11DRAFT_1915799 [Mycena galericulata]|nr:hypothetical protein B0H11DRAFT_1915799 [Mycena galericulata]